MENQKEEPPLAVATRQTLDESPVSLVHFLIGVILLQAGSGLQGVLIPLRAQIEGFELHEIGLLGTAYYVGFVASCLYAPGLILRVGHIRAVAGFAPLAAGVFLLHGLFPSIVLWIASRVVFGFCFGALYTTLESWLNIDASPERRGSLLAIYAVIGAIAMIAGKLAIGPLGPEGIAAFAAVSIAICFAVAPIAFTPETLQTLEPSEWMTVGALYRLSPVGAIGCFLIGATNGAFWTLAPLHAAALDFSTSEIAFYMSAAVLGGAIFQWPLGRWSDRIDRRIVVLLSALSAATIASVLVWFGRQQLVPSLALIAAFGASALPLYALLVAHANDRAPANTFVRVSGGLLLMFGLGAITGPVIGAVAMTRLGVWGLYAFTTCAHLLLALTALQAMIRARSVPAQDKSDFIVSPKTSPALLLHDPRASNSVPSSQSADTSLQ